MDARDPVCPVDSGAALRVPLDTSAARVGDGEQPASSALRVSAIPANALREVDGVII